MVYTAAIIGLGNIAWRFDQTGRDKNHAPYTHAGALESNPKTVIVGGVSIDAKDRQEFDGRYKVPTYSTIEKLFDAVNPDIVSICTPPAFHFEQTIYCLERRVPMIWLEKPSTKTIDELDNLIEMQNDLETTRILVNYPRRYSEIYRQLKDIYDKGIYGKAIMMHVSYSRGLEANGSHMIDTAFYVAGDPERAILDHVMDFSSQKSPSFSFQFSNGLPVIVTGMDLPYQCAEITVTFEDGRAAILYAGDSGRMEIKKEHENFPGFYKLTEITDHPLIVKKSSDYFPLALADLIEAHEFGREPVSSLYTARKSQTLWESVKEQCKKY